MRTARTADCTAGSGGPVPGPLHHRAPNCAKAVWRIWNGAENRFDIAPGPVRMPAAEPAGDLQRTACAAECTAGTAAAV